jgi:hypothetical protein
MPSAGNADEALVLPRHNLEEAALTGAVQPEDADLRARQERQPDVLEDDMVGRMHLAQTFHRVYELRHDSSALSSQLRAFRTQSTDCALNARPDS